ncbi:hypothetical protein SAMN05444392_11258 [Seinonella peptonophila]|uniref:Aminoacetone oxidase family FAD-binding enzyme n=1 Tax=Seinonella peptonophila TaxID=112248 RepID=A0A1M5A7H6_9BACL|nr:NAD(P)/FAD-dependent oxidoreductase [Seinonella peptonophila]SHF26124.1 hypothetical protein SAMN05444392_11258 [Seinonella peptonophila]
MDYDVIVIGGGPSGLMASASAGLQGAKVLLLDKGEKLGKKLAISGGGRCNVTNNKEIDELIQNIPGNGRFLYSVFATFNNRDIIHFFEGLGVQLKEEDHGRMFPVTNKAKTVVQALIQKVKEVGVEIRVNTPVKEVLYQNGAVRGVQTKTGKIYHAPTVILATGGKAASHTGSQGDGYIWAEAARHTITELFPTEVPLTSSETLITSKALQGLSLRDVAISVLNPKGKKIITHRGDMLFTHFGLSGPIALRCSQFVIKTLKKLSLTEVPVVIDLFPDEPFHLLHLRIDQLLKEQERKLLKNVIKAILPDRLITAMFQQLHLNQETTCLQLNQEQIQEISTWCKNFTLQINGTLPLEKAFVTGGGVHVKEIQPKTMESKIMNGLFFCGEILDIHGYTGGYNITAAMCTGFVAGMNAAKNKKKTF